jgi:hypothetical protein
MRDETTCRYHTRELSEERSMQRRRHGFQARMYTEAEMRQMMEQAGIGPLGQEAAKLRLQLGQALAALDVAIQGGRACSDGVYYLEVAGRTVTRLQRLLTAMMRDQP